MYYLIRRNTSHKRLYEDTLDLLVDHNLKTAQNVIDYQREAMGLIDRYYAERKENYDLMRKAKQVGSMKAYDMARYNVEVLSFRLSSFNL